MPKPRKPPRRPKLTESERSLRELAIFVGDAIGFRMGVATYDTPRTRDAALARLDEIVDPTVHLTRLDLASSPDEKMLLTRLKVHLRDKPTPVGMTRAIMLVNLEATLDYRTLGPNADQNMAILGSANMQRDAFPGLCPVPIVFWLNPTAAVAFAQRAPDLYDWRSAGFRFQGPEAERIDFACEALSMPHTATRSLAVGERRERVGMLKDLIIEAENSKGHDSLGSLSRRAALLEQLGVSHNRLGETPLAIRYFNESLELTLKIGDLGRTAANLSNLGNAWSQMERHAEARDCYERALSIARDTGNQRQLSMIMINIGNFLFCNGDIDNAVPTLIQGLAASRRTNDRQCEMAALGALGNAYSVLGQPEAAVLRLTERLVLARKIGDRWSEARALGGLGAAKLQTGANLEALNLYERKLLITQDLGDRPDEAAAYGGLGLACEMLGQVKRARRFVENAVRIFHEIADFGMERKARAHLDRLVDTATER